MLGISGTTYTELDDQKCRVDIGSIPLFFFGFLSSAMLTRPIPPFYFTFLLP
jgi:hypothetical protein